MPLDVNIDDNNTTLVRYQGAWTYRPGSTRQWEGGVHTTGQAGASATFNFRGYQIWVLGTIPAGSGTNAITVSIDGDTSGTITRTSNGSANYDEVYFASPFLRDTSHTIVVTNRGSTASGNSEFMLDRFEFKTEEEVPIFPAFTSATPVSSSTSTSTSTRTSSYVSNSSSSASNTSLSSSSRPSSSSATLTSFTPFLSSTLVTSRPSSTDTSTSLPLGSSSTPKIPWGGIIGGIVSFSVVVIGILLFVLWRKQRSSKLSKDAIFGSSSNSPLAPIPFPSPSDNANSRLLPSMLSEKSSHLGTTTTALSTSSAAGPSLPTDSDSAGPLFVGPRATSFNEKFDFPPPSYQQTSATC